MKGLKTIIRLHKFDLDEKRRQLAQLQTQQEKIHTTIKEMGEAFVLERIAASRSPEAGITFDAYAKAHKKKLEILAMQLMEISKLVTEANEAVMIAFQDLKKYEIALDQQLAKRRKEMNELEQKDNDEKALNSFRQKNKKES